MSLVEAKAGSLSQIPTEEIKARLSAALVRTADGLAEMAAYVGELEARGEDLSSLRLAIMPYLRKIAHRQLLPQLVVSYAGSPQLLSAVASLPIPDQHRLLERGTVAIAVVEEDGQIGSREIDPRALSVKQIPRVFSPDGIVPPRDQEVKPRKKREATRKYSVRVDAKSRRIFVGRMAVPIAEVMTSLAEAAGWQGEIVDEQHHGNMPTAAAKLTENEKARLRAMAKAVNMEESEFVRRAILTWLI